MGNSQRGFIGLIVLLISVAIIAWLSVKLMGETLGTGEQPGANTEEKAAIEQANQLKAALEARYK